MRITAYDVPGIIVDVLADGMRSAGTFSVEWHPSHLSSGFYFYRIDARSQDGSGVFASVKKLVYIK